MQNHCLCLALKVQGIEEERKSVSHSFFRPALTPKPLSLGSHRLNSQALLGIIIEGYFKMLNRTLLRKTMLVGKEGDTFANVCVSLRSLNILAYHACGGKWVIK